MVLTRFKDEKVQFRNFNWDERIKRILVAILPFFNRETTIASIPLHQTSSEKASTLKGKNRLPRGAK